MQDRKYIGSTSQRSRQSENRRENEDDARALSCYDFKARLNQGKCFQRLQLAFGEESPYRATVFRWYKAFCSGRNFHQD
ncbi:UNVERIFIED_CONTAM: hypothetical protein NCL1_49289 [Trichonephila clavipes]